MNTDFSIVDINEKGMSLPPSDVDFEEMFTQELSPYRIFTKTSFLDDLPNTMKSPPTEVKLLTINGVFTKMENLLGQMNTNQIEFISPQYLCQLVSQNKDVLGNTCISTMWPSKQNCKQAMWRSLDFRFLYRDTPQECQEWYTRVSALTTNWHHLIVQPKLN